MERNYTLWTEVTPFNCDMKLRYPHLNRDDERQARTSEIIMIGLLLARLSKS